MSITTVFDVPWNDLARPYGAASGRTRLDQLGIALAELGLTPKQLGSLGEEYADAWLEDQGWRTLSHNWRTRYGELDLVMLTPEHIVVFVEVKTRRTALYCYPQEAVTRSKHRNLKRAASDWLIDRRNRVPHHGIRFDVISVIPGPEGPSVHHITAAF